MTDAAVPSPTDDDLQLDEVGRMALEEAQFLCEQRYGKVRSPELNEEALRRFDERLSAFIEALLSRDGQVVECLLQLLPAAAEPGEVCGIAVALLESRDPRASQGLLAALEKAEEEPKLRGLHMALRCRPIDSIVEPLRKSFGSGTVRQAVNAAEILALHGRLKQNSDRLQQLCGDSDPLIRRAAWRAMALAG